MKFAPVSVTTAAATSTFTQTKTMFQTIRFSPAVPMTLKLPCLPLASVACQGFASAVMLGGLSVFSLASTVQVTGCSGGSVTATRWMAWHPRTTIEGALEASERSSTVLVNSVSRPRTPPCVPWVPRTVPVMEMIL